MVDTPRTTNYLLTSDFQDGQAAGSIVPGRVRELVVSGPQWDAPSGVATPYLMRGTIDGLAWFVANGGVTGTVSSGQRTTNATVLNSLFSTGTTNNQFVELESATYQYSAQLLVPPNGGAAGLWLEGDMGGTILEQFGSNLPCLTIGDTTGATQLTNGAVRGLTLYHGVTQSGLTSSTYMTLGYTQQMRVENIFMPGVFSGPNFVPEDAIQIAPGNSGCFSNIFTNWAIFGWQRHGINFTTTANGSTGNSWDNIYMNITGGIGHTAITGNYLVAQAPAQDQHFKRMNFEWGACNTVIGTINVAVNNWKFDALHLEGIGMTGSGPSIFNILGSSIQVDSLQITSPQILAANFTGTASVITDYAAQASTVKIDTLTFLQNIATQQNTGLQMFLPGSGPLNDDVACITIDGGFVNDGTGTSSNNQFTGHLNFDQHLAATAGVTLGKWGRYHYLPGGSRIEGAVIYATATYTHYGQFEDATIIIPNSITSFTITLSPLMGATGTALPRLGNTVHFRRQVGTISGTVTITNGGGAGGALTGSINTAGGGQDVWVQFTNGGSGSNNWAAFTPVS